MRTYFVASGDVWKRKTPVINVLMRSHQRRIRNFELSFLRTVVFNAVNLGFRVDDRPNRAKMSLFWPEKPVVNLLSVSLTPLDTFYPVGSEFVTPTQYELSLLSR